MFPPDGRLHFDDDENWVYMDVEKLKQYQYTDVVSVAIHELGHTLGLTHTNDQDAIMAPFYHEQTFKTSQYEIPQLHEDDIRRIQQLYGTIVLFTAFTSFDRNDDLGTRGGGFRPEPPPTRTTTEATATTEVQTRVVGGVEGGNQFPEGNGAPCPNEIDDATNCGLEKNLLVSTISFSSQRSIVRVFWLKRVGGTRRTTANVSTNYGSVPVGSGTCDCGSDQSANRAHSFIQRTYRVRLFLGSRQWNFSPAQRFPENFE